MKDWILEYSQSQGQFHMTKRWKPVVTDWYKLYVGLDEELCINFIDKMDNRFSYSEWPDAFKMKEILSGFLYIHKPNT
jgi:hypothetical protein